MLPGPRRRLDSLKSPGLAVDPSASPEDSSAAAKSSAGRSARRDRALCLRLRESSVCRRGLVGIDLRLIGCRGVVGRTERLPGSSFAFGSARCAAASRVKNATPPRVWKSRPKDGLTLVDTGLPTEVWSGSVGKLLGR